MDPVGLEVNEPGQWPHATFAKSSPEAPIETNVRGGGYGLIWSIFGANMITGLGSSHTFFWHMSVTPIDLNFDPG